MRIKLLALTAVAVAAYWFYTGPYQSMTEISYEDQLRINAENMRRCISSQEYVGSGGASVASSAKDVCAKKYNLYEESGNWHRYDQQRPVKFGNTG